MRCRRLVISSASLSRETLLGRECDDRPKDCSLRMDSQLMVGILFSTVRLCSSSLACLGEKGMDVCVIRWMEEKEGVLHISYYCKGVLLSSW